MGVVRVVFVMSLSKPAAGAHVNARELRKRSITWFMPAVSLP
ncbi:hypothetical protein [Corynebacterium diphtheriae]|nr:hypothetical protein [Corynebacterium diphtheriae]UWE73045.1 hypothetical protein NY045_09665 [Corynebacterium diphtheriae bv. gravis]UWE75651.1 hypothetical protein NY043_01830 [Corynebacterium diphtheriae bv. gravis]UWE89298.1 hypothetical protein NY051_06550 [Corynebacterium diphtheriae bv. gravis]UWE94591.1 hypothetical protein NY031_01840 [Corynebacterium diphtheriae bv. gravis]UWF08352.1 hypothetical protein NY049_06205 [Corynebacterium diphtheriae bv. gravis]